MFTKDLEEDHRRSKCDDRAEANQAIPVPRENTVVEENDKVFEVLDEKQQPPYATDLKEQHRL